MQPAAGHFKRAWPPALPLRHTSKVVVTHPILPDSPVLPPFLVLTPAAHSLTLSLAPCGLPTMALTSVPQTTTMTEDDMKRVISGISLSGAHDNLSTCITALSPLIDKAEGRRFLSKQVGETALMLIELFDEVAIPLFHAVYTRTEERGLSGFGILREISQSN